MHVIVDRRRDQNLISSFVSPRIMTFFFGSLILHGAHWMLRHRCRSDNIFPQLHLTTIYHSIQQQKMVSTRSKKPSDSSDTGTKRSAPVATSGSGSNKKAKKEDGKLEVGEDGQIGLKDVASDDKKSADEDREAKDEEAGSKEKKDGENDKSETKPKAGEDMDRTRDEMKAEEGEKAEKGEDEVDEKALQGTKEELDEPKHGTLCPSGIGSGTDGDFRYS